MLVNSPFLRCWRAAVLLLLTVVSASAGTVYRVTASANGGGNGASWSTPMTLQQALGVAISGDEIWVAGGTYKPTTTTNRSFSFRPAAGVIVLGGFGGYEASNTQRSIAGFPTILSGDIGTPGTATDNCFNILVASNGMVIDGFTIRDGYANGSGTGQNGGGGMYITNVSPTIRNCAFVNNIGSYAGGAIFIQNATTAQIENCVFFGNSAPYGGAIEAELSGANPVILDSTFVGNSASNFGSAIETASSPSVTITNCILWGNTGGVSSIYNNGGSSTTKYSVVQGSGGANWNGGVFGTSNGFNLDVDPKFINLGNPAGADGLWMTADDGLRLQSNSPSQSVGISAGALTFDILGRPRAAGAGVEMGAYEFYASSSPLYVVPGGAGTKDGTSFNNGMSLDQALNVAIAGDEIWMMAGTYRPTSTSDRTIAFNLKPLLAIYGGFAGWETQKSQRDWRTNPTILSGDIGVLANSSDNSHRVILGAGYAVLDGLVIRDGRADGSIPYNCGGGLVTQGSPMTIRNCRFTANYAAQFAAGIFVQGTTASSLTVDNSVFDGNTCGYLGGGFMSYQGTASHTFRNCIFSSNSAITYGGAFYNDNDSTWLNCTFYGNSSDNGNLTSYSGVQTVQNCIVWGNTGVNSAIYGSGSFAVSYSDVQGAYAGTGNLNVDPRFTGPGDPDGADNRWGTGDDGLIPQSGSPVVNAGSSGGAPVADIRGAPRGTVVDMGAYERNARWYVEVNGTGDGTGWGSASANLVAVCSAAGADDEIWVKAGTYVPTITTNVNATFLVPSNCSLLGGFVGSGIQRNPSTNRTFLSGDIGVPGVSGDNAQHVVTLSANTAIDGFIIQGGNATTAPNGYGCGGGVLINGASGVTISGCIVQGNTATDGGAGLFVYNGNPSQVNFTVSNCLFANNSAGSWGSAFMTWGATAGIFSHCTMANNTSPQAGGGAVYGSGNVSNVFVRNSIVYGNNSTYSLANYDGIAAALTLSNTLVQGGIGSISGGGTDQGIINGDPGFANVANAIGPDGLWFTDDDGCYPSFGGPAVNLSGLSSVSGQDLVGRNRPSMGLPDLGCYEVPNTVTITATDATATEAGLTTAAVTVTRSGPTTVPQVVYLSVSGSSTASAADYSLPATVTIPVGATSATALITPVDDFLREDAETVVVQLVNGATATISIVSDDVAGFTVSKSAITMSETASDTFTLRLTSQPTAPVRVDVGSNDVTACNVSPSSVTFDGTNWNNPQQITVIAVNDAVADNSQSASVILSAAVSTDPSYNGRDVPDVAVTVTNDDVKDLVFSAAPVDVTEGGTAASYTVRLQSQPTGSVNVTLTPPSRLTITPTSLTFGPADWNVAKTVTVQAIDDDLNQPGSPAVSNMVHTATGADYGGITKSLSATIRDNDPIPTVKVISGRWSKTLTPATVTVTLTGKSAQNISINAATISGGNAVAGTHYTTTTAALNWPAGTTGAKTFNIPVVDNSPAVNGDKTVNIGTTLTAGTATMVNGILTISDAPNPALRVSLSGSQVSEGDDIQTGSVAVTVSLATQPSGQVSLPISWITSGFTAAHEVVVVGGTTQLDFTTGTDATITQSGSILSGGWNVAHTFWLAGVKDDEDDGDRTLTLRFTPGGASEYAALPYYDALITNRDVDTAAVQVTPANGLTVTEAGSVALFTVRLATKPTGTVDIAYASSNTGKCTVNTPGTLNFTPSTWNIPQVVIVTGVDDMVDDGDVITPITITVANSTADSKYSSLDPVDPTVQVMDNDTAGLLLSVASVSVSEAAGVSHTATYTVHLATQPTGTVTVGVVADAQETVSPATLTFDATTWATGQTVTVTAVDDLIAEAAVHLGSVQHSVTSAPGGDAYATVASAALSVQVTDNDTAAIHVLAADGVSTLGSLAVTEAGSTASFTMVLASKPTANVVIVLSSDDTTEGTVTPSSVAFGPSDWNTPKAITVTGVDDRLHDGTVTWHVATAEALSSDQAYNNYNPPDVTIQTLDDDTPGLITNVLGTPITTEAGTGAAFQVALACQPQAGQTVTVHAASGAMGEIGTSADLVFNAGNWNAYQTMSLSGIDDDLNDGDRSVTITLSVIASGAGRDADFDGSTATVTAINQDDDQPAIQVSAVAGLTTTEAGGTDTFTVRLACQPTGSVTIPLSSSDTAEGRVSFDSLVFTAVKDQALQVTGRIATAGWNVPITVTAIGQDDQVVDGTRNWTVVLGTASSSDTEFILDPPDVAVTNADNEVPISVSPASLDLTEGGADGIITISLNGTLGAGRTVTIPVALDNYAQASLSATSVTFTVANANQPQTISIQPSADGIADGDVTVHVLIGAASSTDPIYQGFDAQDIPVLIRDQDSVGLRISRSSGLVTSEAGTTATTTFRLGSRPTADVVVTIAGTSAIAVSPASLTFTTTNWDQDQTLTLTGQDVPGHNADLSVNLTVTVSSGDSNYNGFVVPALTALNLDDDAPGILALPSSGSTAVAEGGSADDVAIRLTTAPTGSVTVTLVPDAQLSVVPSALVFTQANWNVVQPVLVRAVDDADVEGLHTGQITLTASGGGYDGVTGSPITAAITDNDRVGIQVSPVSGIITTESGGSGAFTISLKSRPSANVSIAVASSIPAEVTCSVTTVVFTPLNYATPQTVVLTGVDDHVDDGDVSVVITLAPAVSSDLDYQGVDPDDVTVVNRDDDTAGIALSPQGGLLTSESGGTSTFTVRLTSQPNADVTIALVSNNVGEAVVSPASMTFSSTTWNMPQTATATGQDDTLLDGDASFQITVTATSADMAYVGKQAMTSGLNQDNDTPGLLASLPDGPLLLSEGVATPLRLRVALRTVPTHPVTVTIHGAGTQIALSTGQVILTDTMPIDIELVAVDDHLAEGTVVMPLQLDLSSLDTNYGGLQQQGAMVTITDNDVPGITVTPTSGLTTTEAGGTATFNVVLAVQPLSPITIGLSSSDTTQGTVSPTSLTFLPGSWDIPQTVTVTGADTNGLEDGDVGYRIVTAPAVAVAGVHDPYHGFDAADVLVVNRVVDNPPTITQPADLAMAEDAGLQTVTVTGITSGQASESQSLVVTADSSDVAITGVVTTTYSDKATTAALSFTPPANANGTAAITVNVSDGTTTVSRTFAVVISPVNDLPEVTRNQPLTLGLRATGILRGAQPGVSDPNQLAATDVETTSGNIVFRVMLTTGGGTLKVAGVAVANGGSFTQAELEAGLVTYTHGGGGGTSDGFTFKVEDGTGSSSPAVFEINVDRRAPDLQVAPTVPASLAFTENDGPLLLADQTTLSDSDNTTYNGAQMRVAFAAGYGTGDALTVVGKTTPQGELTVVAGSIRINDITIATFTGGTGGNDLVITGATAATPIAFQALAQCLAYANASDTPIAGTRSITIQVTDPDATATPVIPLRPVVVTPVNDAPVLSAVPAITATNRATTGAVLVTDPDGPGITMTVITPPVKGGVSLNAQTGAFTYTPAAGLSGIDTFVVSGDDGLNLSSPCTVTVRITGSGAVARPWLVTDPPSEVQVGDLLRFTVAADVRELSGSAAITFGVDDAPAGLVITQDTPTTAVITWTAVAGSSDYILFTLTATDATSGAMSVLPVTLRVHAAAGGGG